MTKEEILNMEPGPELDRLVAEKVMGWRRRSHKFSQNAWEWYNPEIPDPYHNKDFVCNDVDLPKFSTDIAAAWKVVNRLREKQFDIMIKTLKDRWEVLISDPDKILDWYATAPELPLAICRAALLAVSAETGKCSPTLGSTN